MTDEPTFADVAWWLGGVVVFLCALAVVGAAAAHVLWYLAQIGWGWTTA